MDSNDLRDRFYKQILREFLLWIVLITATLYSIVFLIFLAISLWESILAISILIGVDGLLETNTENTKPMVLALKSIEMILLAPLGYIFITALGQFVTRISESNSNWLEAFNAVIGAKSMAASLLASIVAVDLVGVVLNRQPIDISFISIEIAIFLSLLLYVVILEKAIKSPRHES